MATVWSRGIYDPMVGHDAETLSHPSPPGPRHLLGTDTLGRDILSMLLAATRPTITVALTGGVVAVIVGTLIGAVSAYYQGGVFDTVFGYVADIFLTVPPPILMVIISTRWFEVISPFRFGLIYGVMAGASSVAVVMRSQGLKMMTQPFIEASRVAGAGDRRIILVHLIPHMLPLATVQMMLTAIGAIIADGFIAFMGVVDFRLNWGTMVYLGLSFFIVSSAVPWPQLLSPVIALSLFATAFYLVSRGLHQVAEPRLRER
jgi:ABC-type dipeptide/oligopeptide/nickel transport system permease subunit